MQAEVEVKVGFVDRVRPGAKDGSRWAYSGAVIPLAETGDFSSLAIAVASLDLAPCTTALRE